MAFLTFAKAKVVAPPIVPRKNFYFIRNCFPQNLNEKNKKKKKKTKHVQI